MNNPNLLPWDVIEQNHRTVLIGESGYNINLDRGTALWEIVPMKGPLPAKLDQKFTTPRDANIAIKDYLDIRRKP